MAEWHIRPVTEGRIRSPTMNSPYLKALLFAVVVSTSHAQITVTGVSDRTAYTDQVTFTVVPEAGYTYDARLDGAAVPVGSPVLVTEVDYHDLRVARTNDATMAVSNSRVQFIVRLGNRGATESGLPPFTPYPPIPSPEAAFDGAHLRLLVPSGYPAEMDIPSVVWVVNESNRAVRVNGSVSSPGQPSFQLFRGVGSGFIHGYEGEESLSFAAGVGGLVTHHEVALESNTEWTIVSGTLGGSIAWPEHSRIAVTNDLTLSPGATLTIGAGSILRVDPGVDIYSEGAVVINGTLDHPVVFAPVSADQPWGGFIMPNSAGRVVATGTIFTGSGEDQDWLGTVGPSSHRPEQPLFACGGDNTIILTDCAAIYLAGQLGHSETGSEITLTLTRFLLQRATTGGEYEDATLNVNDSAFIEFPRDSAEFEDGDHDALYIKNGTHGFTNTLFGWAKDDGIDSGGSGSGLLEFHACWFEGIFHEGNALSGTDKIVNHRHSVFLNCGQAFESGYDGPHGLLEDCLVTTTLTGVRLGDSFDWTYAGSVSATSSLLIYNYRDVWGMNWDDWAWRTNQMSMVGNWLTVRVAEHPDNRVWDPAVDGWRLAAFVNTPPETPVGVGLAVRSPRLVLEELGAGVPVGLSCFSADEVRVDYVMEVPGAALATGSVIFQPGETLQVIPTPPSSPPSAEIVRVRIEAQTGGEITGLQEAWFIVPPADLVAAGSSWRYLDDGSDAGTAWRGAGYDDSSWSSGSAELGYGEGDESTVVSYGSDADNKHTTTYFRHVFDIPNPETTGRLTLHLKRDDGGIVYLNGEELFRSNMDSGVVGYDTLAPDAAPDDGETWFSTNVPHALLAAGTNLLAAEIHQARPTSSDLSFDCRLRGELLPVIQDEWLGEDWVLYWQDPSYLLETAPAIGGPWDGLGTPGPYPVPRSGPREFFRLRRP